MTEMWTIEDLWNASNIPLVLNPVIPVAIIIVIELDS
jgi:hypothetical protein